MLKTNLEQLVEVAVAGEIGHPKLEVSAHGHTAWDGTSFVPVGRGGITLNVKVGDPAFGWASGDHVEPGVAVSNCCCETANNALLTYACIGNEAMLIEACMEGKDVKLKGVSGTVTGKHNGRVIVYFPRKVIERLCIGDRIQIKASGTGLRLSDHPHVTIMNCGPQLLKSLNMSEKAGKVRIPVAKLIPGKLMGSGVGSSSPHAADYDIQATSPEAVKENSLDQLRIGDLVAVTDYDATHGPRWQPEAVTIGIVAHGSSPCAGHGPGICVLMTSPRRDGIEPIITRKANVADLLGLA